MDRREFISIFGLGVAGISFGAAALSKRSPVNPSLSELKLLCGEDVVQLAPENAKQLNELRALMVAQGQTLFGGAPVAFLGRAEDLCPALERNHQESLVRPSVVWNDISNWKSAPQARLDAFRWAKKHLALGGYYVDENRYSIPRDISFSHFEVIYKGQFVTVFRKTT